MNNYLGICQFNIIYWKIIESITLESVYKQQIQQLQKCTVNYV